MRSTPCSTLFRDKRHSPTLRVSRDWTWAALLEHRSYPRHTIGSTPPTPLLYIKLKTSANYSRMPTTCHQVTKPQSRRCFPDLQNGEGQLCSQCLVRCKSQVNNLDVIGQNLQVLVPTLGSNRSGHYTNLFGTADAHTFTTSGLHGRFYFSMTLCRCLASSRRFLQTQRQACGRRSRTKVYLHSHGTNICGQISASE